MEEELRCSHCRRFFEDPILLACGHSYCRCCALKVSQCPSATRPCTPGSGSGSGSGHLGSFALSVAGSPLSPQPSSSSGASDTASLCDQESDKMSIISESDSGVVVSSSRNSRPSSIIGPPLSLSRLPNILTPSTSGLQVGCLVCHKSTYFADESHIVSAPANIAVRNLVQRYSSAQPSCSTPTASPATTAPAPPPPRCDFCTEEEAAAAASITCTDCSYSYCARCADAMHPARGPFATHRVVAADAAAVRRPLPPPPSGAAADEARCSTHRADPLTMYCAACKILVCARCLQDQRHTNHDIQALPTTCKTQKAELTTTLSQLGEKVKTAKGDIGKLKGIQETLNVNANDFKSTVCIQVDAIIEDLQKRKDKLMRTIDEERDRKKRVLRDQIVRCNQQLAKATSLIQFCIELLKEPDPAAYLQISSALIHRSTTADFLWHNDMKTKPEVDGEIVLNLDTKHLQYAIQTLDFAQLKGFMTIPIRGDFSQVPSPPVIDASSCSAENNSVTVVWRPRNDGCAIDGFVLEIDNGRDEGCYKEVYSGPEFMCQLDGLHFNTIYSARVKAYNAAGESLYSDPICLQTASVAWFQLTKSASQREIFLSNESHTLTATTIDYQTILGSVAFSKGVHYWEITVDRFEGNADIVVGVARHAVNRGLMLGKDLHGWSMYVDGERSWYLHNENHVGRVAGGVRKGDVIGVRLNCDRGTLEYTINDRKRVSKEGTFAFTTLARGRYYPAFSINCKAQITVHTAIPCPSSDSE
ncbi:madd-2 [Pristionchus pacificus]|uniref:E3 ubiquitin-protein ligase TRIM9 n=1 Tax=Pristionchus pacificus TaxID=54126 RepID=A0A8R1UG85_PRIPA|nr:madd-2 [Pristionchus pacificus]